MIKVIAPIYLLRSHDRCWKCRSDQEVIALATKHLFDEVEGDLDSEEDPLILSNIEQLPQEVLAYLQTAQPLFQKRRSKTAGSTYYMNTCPCGAHFGDFYLHSEPGGAFFPDTEEQASAITIEELPFTGTVEFACGYSMGAGALIFEYAQRG